MEYIDLRKVGRGGLKEIRRQVVRLKKLGKTGKEIEELTGGTAESRKRNMERVSTRGRKLPGAKKVWAKAWESHGSNPGRTRKYPKGGRGEKAGGFWAHRQTVDVGTDKAVHPETVPQRHK